MAKNKSWEEDQRNSLSKGLRLSAQISKDFGVDPVEATKIFFYTCARQGQNVVMRGIKGKTEILYDNSAVFILSDLPTRGLSKPYGYQDYVNSIFYVGHGPQTTVRNLLENNLNFNKDNVLDARLWTSGTILPEKGKTDLMRKLSTLLYMGSSDEIIIIVLHRTVTNMEAEARAHAMIHSIGVDKLTNEKTNSFDKYWKRQGEFWSAGNFKNVYEIGKSMLIQSFIHLNLNRQT